MNERILDIAIKSGHIVGQLPLNTNEKIQLAGLEKFAELIVAECIDVIQKVKPQYGDYRDRIENAQSAYCIGQIKRHFGVEQ